jgi:hypothetical protein
MWSLVLVVNARLSTTDTDAARQSRSIACMPITSLSFVMVVHCWISTMVNAFALRITRSRRLRLEREG